MGRCDAIIAGSPGNMGARFLHPSRRVTVMDEVKKPLEESEAITFSQAEARCLRAERVGKSTWIVVDVSNGLNDQVRDGFRVLAILEEVGRDSGGPRDRESPQFYPFAWLQSSDVKPDIGPTGLASLRNGEVVLVGGKIADSAEGGRRAVRDDSVLDRPFPSWHVWSELQPGGTEI